MRELQVKLADARSAVELEKLRQQLAAEKQTGKVRLEWHAKDGSRLDKYHAMHDADAERRMNALQPSTAGASDAAGAAKMARHARQGDGYRSVCLNHHRVCPWCKKKVEYGDCPPGAAKRR